jgi:hypothetical protein
MRREERTDEREPAHCVEEKRKEGREGAKIGESLFVRLQLGKGRSHLHVAIVGGAQHSGEGSRAQRRKEPTAPSCLMLGFRTAMVGRRLTIAHGEANGGSIEAVLVHV